MTAARQVAALWLGLLCCATTGCPDRAAQPPPQRDAAPAPVDAESHPELPSHLRLPPEVVAKAGIQTAPVTYQKLPVTVDLSGEIIADPDQSARLVARVPGRIVEVRFKEGQRVKAGTLLVVLESSELSHARATFLAAQARATSAQKNADRLESLARSNLAAGQDVVNALAELQALQAEATAAQRTLLALGLGPQQLNQAGGGRLELRAPIDGFAVARDAVVGQGVSADHPLAELVNLDRAYFSGKVFEQDLAHVGPGQLAEVRLHAYPTEVFAGTVESIGKQLDRQARTVVARIALQNRGDLLKIGLFGSARVSSRSEPPMPSLAIPLTAPTRVDNHQVVFVREADGDFQVHPVILGRSAGGLVEILSGLRVGQQVVVAGTFTLKSALLKSAFAGEP